MLRYSIIFSFLFIGTVASAQDVIEFSEDELATESVLPVFDDAEAVKNKRVETAKRFELGGFAGMTLNEPFYNSATFGGTATFNFTDIHGVNLVYQVFGDGLKSYGKQLQAGEGIGGPAGSFDASRAPHPESMMMGNYQYTAYYGKISLSKFFVMNLSLFGTAGLGMIDLGDKSVVGSTIGIGQNFYLTKRLALRADLKMLIYNGPDVTAPDTGTLPTGGDKLSSDQFEQITHFNSYLTLGLTFIL